MKEDETSPADKSAVLSTGVLTNAPRAIYVGGAGNIVGKLIEDDADRTFTGLQAGVIYPLRFTAVTSMTATNCLALY